MKITIEIETDDDGRAIRARVIGGGVRKVHRTRPPVTLARPKDGEDMLLLREFIATHGPAEAARRSINGAIGGAFLKSTLTQSG